MFLLNCVYIFITTDNQPTYNDCGIVLSKSNDEIAIKHGVKTELYLNIQFNKSGFKSVNVEPTTYFSKKVNDRICFDLNESQNWWRNIRWFIGFATLFMLCYILVILFVEYLVSD